MGHTTINTDKNLTFWQPVFGEVWHSFLVVKCINHWYLMGSPDRTCDGCPVMKIV